MVTAKISIHIHCFPFQKVLTFHMNKFGSLWQRFLKVINIFSVFQYSKVLYNMESGVTLLLNKLKPQCFVPKLVEIGPVLLEKISKSRQCIFTIFSYLPLEQKTTILVFVCLEFIIPLENFSLIWTHHHCRWRAANIVLCSALMAIMSSEGSLTCHTHCNMCLLFVNMLNYIMFITVYNGHLQGPLTLTPVAFGSGAVTTCFYN